MRNGAGRVREGEGAAPWSLDDILFVLVLESRRKIEDEDENEDEDEDEEDSKVGQLHGGGAVLGEPAPFPGGLARPGSIGPNLSCPFGCHIYHGRHPGQPSLFPLQRPPREMTGG
jgi:hypothetical protein